MPYHLVKPVFDTATENSLSQLITDHQENLVEKEFILQEITAILANDSTIKSLEPTGSELILIEVILDFSLATDLFEEVASRLSEVYPFAIFLLDNQYDKDLGISNVNFPGFYLRQAILRQATLNEEAVFANIGEAVQLHQFIQKNRVAIIEEGEGRSRQYLINVALNLWKKENKRVVPFFIDEHVQSYHEVFSAMFSFLTEIHQAQGLKEQLDLLKTTQEKLELLTSMLHEFCLPVFVFQNISSWFDVTGKPHYAYRDLTDWLYKLAGNGGEYLVVTNSNIAGEMSKLPIFKSYSKNYNTYKANAFRILASKDEPQKEVMGLNETNLKAFYHKTAGSEVALQLGIWLHLQDIIALAEVTQQIQVKTKGLEKKAFLKAIETYLPDTLLKTYSLLAQFHVPIPINTLKEHLENIDFENILSDTPLIEVFEDSEQAKYYYLHPGCRAYFSKMAVPTFDHKKAGVWYQSKINMPQRGLSHLKEAYRHYLLAKYDEGIKKTATALCQHYYKAGNYPVAHHYGLACYQRFEKDNSAAIFNCLALIFKKYKKPEESLFFFKILHEKYASETLNKKQVRVLNYMSMLHFEMKDMENYVYFGLDAYKLSLELKETKEIYQIGQSLGRFLYMGGKKEEGVKMMKQSYQIGVTKGYADVGALELFLRSMGEM